MMFEAKEPNAIEKVLAAFSEFFTRDVLARSLFLFTGAVLICLSIRALRVGGFTHFQEFRFPSWEIAPWLSATGVYCIYVGLRKKPPD
jgi:hypothetical protein